MATLTQDHKLTTTYNLRMDGCKLIIEYEVDCTFEYPDEGNDKIAVLDKETETSKGKIRHSSPDIYLNRQPIPIRICSNTGKSVFSRNQLVF